MKVTPCGERDMQTKMNTHVSSFCSIAAKSVLISFVLLNVSTDSVGLVFIFCRIQVKILHAVCQILRCKAMLLAA